MIIAPKVLPGYVNQRLARRSRLLFHWRAADLSLTPVTGEVPTFARASGGGMVADARGCPHDFAQAQPRFELSGYNAVTGLWETPGLLLEGPRTNLIPYSQDLSNAAWTNIGTPTLGTPRVWGGLSLDLLGDDNGAGIEGKQSTAAIGFTASGTRALSFHLSAATAASTRVAVTGAGANVVDFVATWTAGVPSVVAGGGGTYGGVVLLTELVGPALYRVLAQLTGINHTDANKLNVYPAGAVAAATGAVYVGGFQAEDATFPSSYTKTLAAAVARDSDALSYPFAATPQAMTWYARLLNRATGANNRTYCIVSDVGTNPAHFLLDAWAGVNRVYHDAGAGEVHALAVATPAVGDLVELRGVLQADGAVYLGQAINGAAEVVTAASAATPLAAAWSSPLLTVGCLGAGMASQKMYGAVHSVRIAAGVRTMDYMRSAF
jgi:hypothetical protein